MFSAFNMVFIYLILFVLSFRSLLHPNSVGVRNDLPFVVCRVVPIAIGTPRLPAGKAGNDLPFVAYLVNACLV